MDPRSAGGRRGGVVLTAGLGLAAAALLLCAAGCSPKEEAPAKVGFVLTGGGATGAQAPAAGPPAAAAVQHVRTPIERPEEKHLRNVRMLTDGGENAEAYWSWDGTRLVFQARRGEDGCDKIYTMKLGGEVPEQRKIVTDGACTCAYFLPGDERVIFSSTMSGGTDCPPRPDMSQGYVWGLYPDYEIYSARPDGTDVVRLTDSPGYDAEATARRDGRIVFTSVRDGDLDIYSMKSDGSDVRRLTDAPGYDGGPWFSPDGTRIIYRAHHPTDPQELADYRALLAKDQVRPGKLEIWVMNADGSDQRQVTNLGGANFAPFFTPDGQGIVFVSNHHEPRSRNFDVFLVRLDGTGLERVTYNETFDGFPMFSPDGTKLVFCSNRGTAREGDTNVFVADWVP